MQPNAAKHTRTAKATAISGHPYSNIVVQVPSLPTSDGNHYPQCPTGVRRFEHPVTQQSSQNKSPHASTLLACSKPSIAATTAGLRGRKDADSQNVTRHHRPPRTEATKRPPPLESVQSCPRSVTQYRSCTKLLTKVMGNEQLGRSQHTRFEFRQWEGRPNIMPGQPLLLLLLLLLQLLLLRLLKLLPASTTTTTTKTTTC